jgi:hypothetical protein
MSVHLIGIGRVLHRRVPYERVSHGRGPLPNGVGHLPNGVILRMLGNGLAE